MRYLLLFTLGLFTTGCRLDMHDQPRYRFNSASNFWGDGRAARPAVPNTVPRGMNKSADTALYSGKVNGELVAKLPMPLTKQSLDRGQDRYKIFCSPCHGLTGYGDGMIVTRGLKNPPSYHTEALRDQPIGHFFDVISNGSGEMKPYAARIPVNDRWAIAAYLRVLQQSQNVKSSGLSAEEQQKVNAGPEAPKSAEPKPAEPKPAHGKEAAR
ncbi:MAG TPA: cytochrome c [Bryobacteraceae bacterium]|nr:cytochrome c [Bryobacteraceae bacterium]